MPSAKAEVKLKETAWNLRKPGGWEAFKVKTDELAEKLENIVEDKEKSIEDVMENVIKLENKAKFSSFGKTRKQGYFQTKTNLGIKNCGNKNHKCYTEEEINVCLLKSQSQKIEKEIMNVKESSTGRVVQVFKMKAKITGSKKSGSETLCYY